MKHRTRHGEHVPHGYAHVHSAKGVVNLDVVRTMLQRAGIVTADLAPDARRAFQVIF